MIEKDLITKLNTHYKSSEYIILKDHESANFDLIKNKYTPFLNISNKENLWVGIKDEKVFENGLKPKIVSFYTKKTNYEICAKKLKKSLMKIAYNDFLIEGVEATNYWETNCSFKPSFILHMLKKEKKPVLWVDADAQVKKIPYIPEGVDFALHLYNGWEFASGTLFFNYTESAILLLEKWCELSALKPIIWDQMLLDEAWSIISKSHELTTCWLPNSYTYIFDQPNKINDPHIIHFQESRNQIKRDKPLYSQRLVEDRKYNIPSNKKFDIKCFGSTTNEFNWQNVELDLHKLIDYIYKIRTKDNKKVNFIQIGAMDGIRFDPLHKHIKEKSFEGFLIEPNYEMFNLLRENYSESEGLTFINSAIHSDSKVTLNRIPKEVIDNGILPEWALGISSIYTNRNALGGKQVDDETLSLIKKHMISEEVDCITIESLIENNNLTNLDILQIDTEGNDWNILSSFPVNKIAPLIINFEYYNLPSNELHLALNWLLENGYIYSKDHKDITATLLRFK